MSPTAWWFALALCVAGCDPSRSMRGTPLPPANLGGFVPLTKPMLLVGDTQEHEATGMPLHTDDDAIDSYLEVTQRPPQQPLFGRHLLAYVLRAHPDTPIIHLGDLVDMSCLSELRRMTHIIELAQQPGAIIPGNHDGLLFGIFNYDILADYITNDSLEWRQGCRHGASDEDRPRSKGGRGPGLDKRKFIASYVEMLGSSSRPIAGIARPSETGNEWITVRNPKLDPFIERVEARLVGGRNYARSFITQKLRAPRAAGAQRSVTIIGIDTNQIRIAIGTFNTIMGRSPGTTGQILDDQIKVIEDMISEARTADEIVVLAGHHDWENIEPMSRHRLENMLRTLDHPLVYLSAHTHSGFWAVHDLGDRPMLELNTSSLSDWPIAYRLIQFEHDPVTNRIRVIGRLMPSKDEADITSDGDLIDGWIGDTCSKTGLPIEMLRKEDIGAVEAQREQRGSLFSWLIEGLAEWCEECRARVYDSAGLYQDLLLETIESVWRDMGGRVPELGEVRPPPSCGALSVAECSAVLRALQPQERAERIEIFRRKAALVDWVQDYFDQIDSPTLSAYMACRAALAAKADFELTDEKNRPGLTQVNRRSRAFFLREAAIGLR